MDQADSCRASAAGKGRGCLQHWCVQDLAQARHTGRHGRRQGLPAAACCWARGGSPGGLPHTGRQSLLPGCRCGGVHPGDCLRGQKWRQTHEPHAVRTSCRGVAYLNKQRHLGRRLLLPESVWFCCLGNCHACQISTCGGAGALQHTALIKTICLTTKTSRLHVYPRTSEFQAMHSLDAMRFKMPSWLLQ